MYFSRAPIPFDRDSAGDVLYHQHVGVYAYTREALDRWVRLAPVPEERWERLEQLRPLLRGLAIGVALFPGPAAPGVDTADDPEDEGFACQRQERFVRKAAGAQPRRNDAEDGHGGTYKIRAVASSPSPNRLSCRGLSHHTVACAMRRKLSSNCFPWSVPIDSGWNCTP